MKKMSNIIPPLLSTTPPPIDNLDEDDDEFGEFTTAVDISYGCDALSIPNTPQSTPIKVALKTDVNSNKKDYLDKRKLGINCESSTYTSKNHLSDMPNVINEVPSEFNSQNSVESYKICSAIVPEKKSDFDSCTVGNQSVPSNNINKENDDFLREEPPEIFPEDNEEEFNEFSTNFDPIIGLEELDVSFNDDILLHKNKDVTGVISDIPAEDFNTNNVIITKDFVQTNYENQAIEDIHKDIELSAVVENQLIASIQIDTAEEMFNNSVNIISEIIKPNEEISQCSLSDEEFGDFETPSVSNHQVEEKARDSSSKSNMTSDDEEFCDFKHVQVIEVSSNIHISDKESIYINQEINVNILTHTIEEHDDYSNSENDKKQEHSLSFVEDEVVELAGSDIPPNLEDDDDFGDFEAPPIRRKSVEIVANDFSNFEATEDNFGDFKAHFPSDNNDIANIENTTNLTMDANNVLEKSEKIIIEMFAISDIIAEDFSLVDYTTEDFVFKEVRDVTDTNALTYQWAKSRSQKSLLKALNIDTRNILYGSGWNPSMPKFAANLSQSPLEPMKSDILTPTPVQPSIPSNTSQSAGAIIPNSSDIPSAQFDWNGSGLTNPLDSVSNDEKTSTPPTVKNPPVLKPSTQFDTDSVNSLQFTDLINEPDDVKTSPEIDDFEDFTSFQETSKVEGDFNEWSGNVVPLRETHINNVESFKKIENDEPGWLKPTILTPILSRKDNEIKEDVIDVQTSTALPPCVVSTVIIEDSKIDQPINDASALGIVDDDDEFDDFTSFQSNLPKTMPPSNMSVLQPNTSVLQPNILQPTGILKSTSVAAEINWPDPGITDDELSRFDMYSKKSDDVKIDSNSKISSISEVKVLPKDVALKPGIEDDSDFSDYMAAKLPETISKDPYGDSDFSIFNTGTNEITGSKKPENDAPKLKTVSQDNGLFKKMQQKHIFGDTKNTHQVFEFANVTQPKHILNLPILDGSPRKFPSKKIEHKPKNQDDDDWTDFVSNQEVLKPNLQIQRTHTPELSLSIPQLSQIQPPKLPIPVITPHGLMQTKIPSIPSHQAKGLAQQPLHVKPPEDGYQPAIISNQFAMQFYQNGGPFMSNKYQTTNLPTNQQSGAFNTQNGFNLQNGGFIPNSQSKIVSNDDEWSEFVSSRPPTNELPINSSANYSNWSTNLTPNIITNPAHYQNLDGKQRSAAGSQSSKNLQSKKKSLASVSSMPELDFVAPKNSHRTLQNKK